MKVETSDFEVSVPRDKQTKVKAEALVNISPGEAMRD